MAARRPRRTPEPTWRRLRENPDYVSDWRASASATLREGPPYAFRRQTEADLGAARWGLLAWENPRHPDWAELFWADAAMTSARVAPPVPAWRRLILSAGATYAGLRLLDGALVLKVTRGRETGQVRVIDATGFDPASCGLEVETRHGAGTRWVRIRSVDRILTAR